MDLLIREARPEDHALLYALDQSCFVPGIAYSRAELEYFLRYPRNLTVVAETDAGDLAGFAIGGTQRRRGAVAGRLITIDVHAQFRRQGVGSRLLGAMEERLRGAGAMSLILEVAVDNTEAQAFYDRHGFSETGRIRGYYLNRIDALTMEKALHPQRP